MLSTRAAGLLGQRSQPPTQVKLQLLCLFLHPPAAEAELSVSGNSSGGGTSSAGHQTGSSASPASSPPPCVATLGPQVIPRRHAPADIIARQGSFRGFPALTQKTSPFKRQLSLRMNELPSTMQRKSDFPSKNTGQSGLSVSLPAPLRSSDGPDGRVSLCVVPEVEGEGDSISSLCTQIASAFSGPPEDPFSSAPMPKPASSPQSPAAPGKALLLEGFSFVLNDFHIATRQFHQIFASFFKRTRLIVIYVYTNAEQLPHAISISAACQ